MFKMVDKKKIEEVLAKMMDDITSLEGIIAAKTDGTVIVGQTIMDTDQAGLQAITTGMLKAAKEAVSVCNIAKKGKIQEMLITSEKGFLLLAGAGDLVLIAIGGEDAKSQLALIRKSLKIELSKLIG